MSADERYKGHDELLDVWPALLARKPDARLVVAGDGDDRPRLESRAASLGLSHAVTLRRPRRTTTSWPRSTSSADSW